jgi:phosphotransacetylase
MFGKCSFNPESNLEVLTDIDIQSTKFVVDFKIDHKVIMLSYSTSTYGTGSSIDKV